MGEPRQLLPGADAVGREVACGWAASLTTVAMRWARVAGRLALWTHQRIARRDEGLNASQLGLRRARTGGEGSAQVRRLFQRLDHGVDVQDYRRAWPVRSSPGPRPEHPGGGEPLHAELVGLRPGAPRLARAEELHRSLVVERPDDAVDPPEAERLLDGVVRTRPGAFRWAS